MIDLKNKNILLIIPKFFNYDLEINKELKKYGANVFTIYENINDLGLIKRIICRFTKTLKTKLINKYFINKLNKIKKLDYVFCIRGFFLNEKILNYIKSRFLNIKMYLYQWDSIQNNLNSLVIKKFFDKVISFDSLDCHTYGWKFLPLFYVNDKNYIKKSIKYDLTFIGSLHSERAFVLKKIKELAKRKKYKIYYFLFSTSFLSCCWQIIMKSEKYWEYISLDEINFKPLSREEIKEIYQCSKIIIDYSSPNQNGLSMRTIECLSLNVKLLTNNHAIKYYDFYDPQNILVYDLDNLSVPDNFIKSPYKPIPKEIVENYSLDNWIKTIFSD